MSASPRPLAREAVPLRASAPSTPLVGRDEEMRRIGALLDQAASGQGGTLLIAGEPGVGKTRLTQEAAARAAKRFQVAVGRAYEVESGVPYALFSDALLPILRTIDSASLQVLSRGGQAELHRIFPALGGVPAANGGARGDPAELKARLLWNLSQFLGRLAARKPLLLILENLQWADASSLELFHFLARQVSSQSVAMIATFNDAARTAEMRTMQQSLQAIGAAELMELAPLASVDTVTLVSRLFGAEGADVEEFSSHLHEWTRGNPFFLEETLKALVESGTLRQRDGRWLGWDTKAVARPRTVRDAVLARLDRLTPDARTVANFASVIGTRVSFDALRAVSGLADEQLLPAIDELREARVLEERADEAVVTLDFAHPIIQDTLYDALGRARARLLHGVIAEALERMYGATAMAHAGELAVHYARSDASNLADKATRYLAAAGRDALARSSTREAAGFLLHAVEMAERSGLAVDPRLIEDLARARQRLGEYDSAVRLWQRVQLAASEDGDDARVAAIDRRMGLAAYWTGRYDDALEHLDRAIARAREIGDTALAVRAAIAKGAALLDVGRRDEARVEVERALEDARSSGEDALLTRAHRALALLHLWSGPADKAREHGTEAIRLAERSGDRSVMWSAHWALATLGGLTGDAQAVSSHLRESERIADELQSPVLALWSSEVAVEYASAIGDWSNGLELAERQINLARGLGPRTVLPRLLVWSAMMRLGRGDLEGAKAELDEAWEASGAAGGSTRMQDIHTVVPAHAGLAAYHLATQQWDEAIRVGEAGLALVDRTGYVVWGIHRLLPVILESSLWALDWERVDRYGERLRRESDFLGHRLGLAWADTRDALVAWLKHRDFERASGLLRAAADGLDAIPFVEHGARLRRFLASVLAENGDREGAMRELRQVHDTFARLGAVRELAATRDQLRALGARPPVKQQTTGAAGLTGRELEIARLVAARRSNKAIGDALGISPRTVGTHLSNIFGKLGVSSRGELADFVRERGLPLETDGT